MPRHAHPNLVRRAIPTARILKGVRDKKWAVVSALAEFIDNAFGERRGAAKNVWIDWNRESRVLSILDDGRGMRNVADLFILGEGTESGDGDIGLYGMGGSEAGAWLADREDVWTLKRGRRAHMMSNWQRCVDRREFPVITDEWLPARLANCPTELLAVEHGTLIRLQLRRGIQINAENIQARLSRMFSVGLRSNRHLTWMTVAKDGGVETQIQAWNPGDLENSISGTVTLANGLSAKIEAGHVSQLSVENSKLSLNYVYRQVKETSRGFGRPIQGVVGYIDLSKDWLECLTTTKDDIREDCRNLEDELMDQIQLLLKPLLEQVKAANRSRIFKNVKLNLTHTFNAGFKREVEGTSDGGSGHGGLTLSPGPSRPRVRTHTEPKVAEISIDEVPGDQIQGLLCQVELDGEFAQAWVNKDHALIKTALESEPVNQRLLEQVLITALSTEIMKTPDALVRLGVFSRPQAAQLLEKHQGNQWNMHSELVRTLTDSIIDVS